ncbi:hypothetical protein ElyMa_007068000 [Elysia marginata]|uniref:Serpin domain-containing protein n=1 Tax=Elysia marginata TaxID=1093978 RepID=A0AAV4JZR8_9GAST|nr:hypothetical protein ElyMa_007068000 [Elysia marginata]
MSFVHFGLLSATASTILVILLMPRTGSSTSLVDLAMNLYNMPIDPSLPEHAQRRLISDVLLMKRHGYNYFSNLAQSNHVRKEVVKSGLETITLWSNLSASLVVEKLSIPSAATLTFRSASSENAADLFSNERNILT